ncbi:MAG: carboxymuconolactone decarboxylase family protein [Acidobacteriota bacterium]|nr:carboxymuconolactone decarboxylase family protein [Acidobacteriota bacterium]
MTWFDDLPEGPTEWDRMHAAHPEALSAMARLYFAAWADSDPVLLELARLRMATLLRFEDEHRHRSRAAREAGLSEEKVAAVGSWPTSPLFSAAERSCLALVEQFALDASAVTDEQVSAVAEHLGDDGCYVFVEAVSALETFQRACLTMGITTTPGVDRLVELGHPPSTEQEEPS